MFQATITYALMLVAMLVPSYLPAASADISCRTFNVAYFVSIIVGLSVGEVMFGRWASASYC